jgi:hypothetical protein
LATVIDEKTGEILSEDETPEPEPVELDEPGDETPPEPEPEPEPEPAPLSEKEIEAMMKALDKEATSHTARVSKLLGEEALALIPCAMCMPNVQGFYFPGSLDDEKRAAIMAALGVVDGEDLETDAGTKMCDYCKGHGETITGSKVANQVTRVCPECMGNGWQTQEQAAQRAVVHETAAVASQVLGENVTAPPVAYDLPNVDAWTRPKGHPNYGKNPVYMSADERGVDWEGAR